jgi:hypothetical protein
VRRVQPKRGWRWTAAAALALLTGCRGPALPKGVTLDGATLEKATNWSAGGISGVVFIPAGERLDTASLQLGVLLSEKHASGRALSAWVMEQYHGSPTLQLYENAGDDEACKAGATSTDATVRPFLALHLCRGGNAHAACAEVDEKLVDPSGSPCPIENDDCWQKLCDARWADRRATLEAIVDQVLAY